MSKKAIVIGAGIAGIASAIRLQHKGFHVKVLEKNAYPGGKLSEVKGKGYRFDAGPSLFTLPHLVDELFELFDENPADFFSYHKLTIITRYFYENGLVINAYSNAKKFAQEVEQKTKEPQKNVLRFLTKSRQLYNLTADIFIFNSIHRLKNIFHLRNVKALFSIHKLQAFSSMDEAISRYIAHPDIQQLFNRYATYNGSNPYQAPGTLNVIPHLEHNMGAFFPEKGMFDITQSLVKLAKRKGVEFLFNTKAEKVNLKKNRATTVETQTQTLPADIVVSDSDIVPFYKNLLPEIELPKKYLKQERSSSALIFYWGVKGTFPALDVHNIFFSNNYPAEFNALFNKKEFYHDPTVYVFISSKKIKTDAPKGCENWFVMVNAPPNNGQNWDMLIQQCRKNILKKLKKILTLDIEKQIEFEQVLDPQHIQNKTLSYKGSLYGSASNNRFAAFQRHANFHNIIKNLYFCGGSVHPGGGIPLSLASAKIIDRMI